MQQHAHLLQRRAPFIVRLRPRPRLPRFAPSLPVAALRPRSQQRCISYSVRDRGLTGDAGFRHLGGLHYFRVRLPDEEKVNDIDEWLRALNTCLPTHLRKSITPDAPEISTHDLATRRDVALVLILAQKDASFDLLEHLGVVEGNWEAVSWITQTIAQGGLPLDIWSKYPLTTPLLKRGVSLDEFTSSIRPLIEADSPFRSVALDQVTIDTDPRFYDSRLQRGALGQIWQSIGKIIIRAAERTDDAKTLMPQALSLLATLHHHGIVPDSVYKETPHSDPGAPQQPPLLHMLSSKILTALSDAAWDARQATLQATKKTGRGKYSSWSFGLESPGVRYRSASQDLRPEVWLELVLWSCLHGGWTEEGANILQPITKGKSNRRWSLICWQKLIESANSQTAYRPSFSWRDAIDIMEGARPEAQPRPSADDKALVVRTVSSEVIAAYVDAMVAKTHVGVGGRGVEIRRVLKYVKRSKDMLGRQNLGLGFATWDVIAQRLMESGGVWLERHPSVVLRIARLVEPFGRETEAENSAAEDDGAIIPPYFTGASALALNLLHRVLYTQTRTGSFEGTISALRALQDFNELNQRRSIEQFFEKLKQQSLASPKAASLDHLFDTGLAAADYPSFFPQLSIYVLSGVLSVIKNVQDADLYRWVFDSGDATEPLISRSMYQEAGLAPALVRFSAATDNQAVLENVMTHHSRLSQEQNALIPTAILTALVEALIQKRKWPAVMNVLTSLLDNYGNNDRDNTDSFNMWETRLLATMSRELLLIARDSGLQSRELDEATTLYSRLVATALQLPRQQTGLHESDAIFMNVALLASVDEIWGRFCSRLGIFPPRSIYVQSGTPAFNLVLEGVLETRGLNAGRKFWEKWCHPPNFLRRFYHHEGGVWYVPRRRPNSLSTPMDESLRTIIQSTPAHTIELRRRIRPSLDSLRLMRDSLEADKASGRELDYDVDEVQEWIREYAEALSTFKYSGDTTLADLDGLMDRSKSLTSPNVHL